MPEPPKYAFYSGYYTDYNYFREILFALRPDWVESLRGGYYDDCAYAYRKWRDELSDDDYPIVPPLKVILEFPDASTPNMGADKDNKFLFPNRYVPAPEGSEVEDFPAAMLETEIDRTERDQIFALIERHSGFKFVVDKDRLHWGCLKDLHPHWDLCA